MREEYHPNIIVNLEAQAGDAPVTYADFEALERDYGFRPEIGIREGQRKLPGWYYYR